uniref:Uncharacterized protein n=1 Tax=Salix viminalis TaxID=40686 RepID=A0A6N2KEJ3_SALVM
MRLLLQLTCTVPRDRRGFCTRLIWSGRTSPPSVESNPLNMARIGSKTISAAEGNVFGSPVTEQGPYLLTTFSDEALLKTEIQHWN